MDRITKADLAAALEHHKLALEAVGIKYEGELRMDHGSKTYGNAYRIYRTNVPIPAGEAGEGRWADVRISSAHYNPPVGSDFLGMTAREAYDNLTTRTSVLWDVARHLKGNAS